MAVILIDVEAATASIVPGSLTTNRFSFPMVTWSSDGEWVFIASVLDEAGTTGRLLAYGPSGETAYQIPVDLGTEHFGMAVD